MRLGGTDHRLTGNDRWGALLRVTGTIELDGVDILIDGAASMAGWVGQTEAGPFGLGARADWIASESETTRTIGRAGMAASFPGNDDPNVALVPLYAFGIAEPWLLGPHYVSLVGGARFEERLARHLHFALDGMLALMFSPEGGPAASGVAGIEAGLVLGPVWLIGRLSAAFAGLHAAVAGQPRLHLDFGDVWLEAGGSATFVGTLPADQGGYGIDVAGGFRF
jgi:hypothetical protein